MKCLYCCDGSSKCKKMKAVYMLISLFFCLAEVCNILKERERAIKLNSSETKLNYLNTIWETFFSNDRKETELHPSMSAREKKILAWISPYRNVSTVWPRATKCLRFGFEEYTISLWFENAFDDSFSHDSVCAFVLCFLPIKTGEKDGCKKGRWEDSKLFKFIAIEAFY